MSETTQNAGEAPEAGPISSRGPEVRVTQAGKHEGEKGLLEGIMEGLPFGERITVTISRYGRTVLPCLTGTLCAFVCIYST